MERQVWRKVFRDLRERRHVDAYALAFTALALAVISVATDIVPEQVRWAAILAGVGLLVLRTAIPAAPSRTVDEILEDRFSLETTPFAERVKNVREIWVFAPSAANLLTPQNCESLRKGPLNRADGIVRVVVLDPNQADAVQLATKQLDDSLDYPVQDFGESLASVTRLLRSMASWNTAGSFEYRYLSYNPGFSLVAIDPGNRFGYVIVEVHGFHNVATSARMHLEIASMDSRRWNEYWADQFSRIWESALDPGDGGMQGTSGN